MHVFQDTVSALCYTVIGEHCRPPESSEDFPHNRVVRFVLEQHGRTSWFVRWPVFALTVAFGLSALLRRGRPFHASPEEVRARHWKAWRGSRLRVCRDLMTFYESLTVFSWYAYRTSEARSAGSVRSARTAA